MIILDGKEVNTKRAKGLKEKVASSSVVPHLVIIQVGDNAESNVYIGQKVKFGERIGAKVTVEKLQENVTTHDIINVIHDFNNNPEVHGIILQLPVPDGLELEEILNSISPEKDVDGLSATNIRRLATNDPRGIVPATAKGVVTLLKEHDVPMKGKHVVIVGRSLLVGKSAGLLFLNNDATVTICHRYTEDLKPYTTTADILVVAVGKPNLITRDHVKEGQVIVDVGITALGDGDKKITGDVDFEEVKDIVSAISPVPGGVGPMTVLSLFENLLRNI